MGRHTGVEFPRHDDNPFKIPYNVAKLFLIQRGQCFHCDKPMLWRRSFNGALKVNDKGWSREHVKPISLGGRNDRNIVLAHLKCNSRRGTERLSDELLAKYHRIWLKMDVLHTREVVRFLRNKELYGTYAACYDWPNITTEVE